MTREEQIKVGTVVRTIKDKDFACEKVFPVGTIGIVERIDNGDILPYKIVANNDYFYYSRDMFEIIEYVEPCEDAISRDFEIGDEVRMIGSDPIYDDCDVGWVVRNASEKVKTMYVMRNDGSADEENKAEWYKTGRHNAVLAEVIKALPSVTPSRRKGHWIHFANSDDCSECGWSTGKYISPNRYCPHCGAEMVEPKESEGKE